MKGGNVKNFKLQSAYLVFMFVLTVFLILPGCGKGVLGGGSWNKPPVSLMSIEVTPPNQNIAKGTTQQFLATGVYSDQTTSDLTQSVTWASSNAAVASVSTLAGSNGLVTSVVIGGPVTISATDPATGKAGTATLTVTPATLSSIGVTRVNASIALQTKEQFIATGTFSDSTTQDLTSSVNWNSSNPAVASISNAAGSNGVASALAAGGPIAITATDPVTGKAGTANLTVTAATLSSLEVTPVNPSLALGLTEPFVATGVFSDLSTQNMTLSVTWSSSNAAVATISNLAGSKGLVRSLAAGGPITITATDPATGKVGTTSLTVTAATLSSIGITPIIASIDLGTKEQFVATGTYTDLTTQNLTSSLTWSSSNAAVASVSNAAGFKGLASSLSIGGPVTVTATDPATGKTATATLTVTPATLLSIAVTPVNPSTALGTKEPFIATGTYTDLTTKILTTSVTWTSSNTSVATISNAAGLNGIATSLTTGGPVTITATDPLTAKTGTSTLTITAATLSSLTVSPVNPVTALATNEQYKATGTYSDLSTQDLTSTVTWSSSNTAVAAISNAAGSNGLATPKTLGGPITITATDPATGKTGNTTLTISGATLQSIAVTPAGAGIAVGGTQQFIATATYSDTSTRDITSNVTWTTTPLVSVIASIDNAAGFKGLATGLAVGGPVTMTATDPATGILGAATLTVTRAPNLGAAAPFGAMGGNAGLTNQGIFTVINGNIGTSAASTLITGFHDTAGNTYTETPLNVGAVNGIIYTATAPPGSVPGVIAAAGLLAANTAYTSISPAALPGGIDVSTLGGGAGELGNRTLAPGVYKSAPGTFAIALGNLTLDAGGNANAVWVFQMASSLTVGIAGPTGARSVILVNGAQAKNVFWQVGSAATINAAGGGTMVGTIIASSGAAFSTAGNVALTTLNGRALGLNASVTLVNTIINVPAP
jgi:hypothetical protein